ncbi:hypothetical protein [Clostridium sp. Marseille-Q2269]|uniref:hypothetical protein n=1 Tax=Clostridium sp. Marseille-Q2269 TaxID=2942205 RepID=UPI0020744F3A|nr:hypothetical protein [Clostridium sp. Marseille-Q2269]
MENKIIDFKNIKLIKNNNLKKQYKNQANMIDDMNWIIKALEIGIIDKLDIIFKYDNKMHYYGTSNDKTKNEIKQELLNNIRNLHSKAIIEYCDRELKMKRMATTMLGETVYTLKDIEHNQGIKVTKLRTDIKNGILVPAGKQLGNYYIIQSELDKYLKIVKKKIEVSEEQINEMKHALGLNHEKKPYRNKFYCSSNDEKWDDLVNKGLAEKGSDCEENRCYFLVSKLGVAFILGRSISIKRYNDL